MDRKRTFLAIKLSSVSFFILFIVGCGQVGFITGGPVDKNPPRPLVDEVSPPNASKNTKPTEIIIPFDEFIALNNPSQNIRIVPEDVRLEPKIKGKSLVLKPIEGEWADTTTYAIYLNRAVKDLTESNDSLMIYVFSTGNKLDSLEAAVNVIDAFTNEPLKEVTVGLFTSPLADDTSKTQPRYIASTNEKGEAFFKYLKKGPFYVYAFLDENRNNVLDPNEKRGAYPQTIIGDTVIDVIPQLRLMPPPPSEELIIKTNEFIAPSVWSLAFNQPILETTEFEFFEPIPVGTVWNNERDSVLFYFGEIPRSGRFETTFQQGLFNDTISKKYFLKQEPVYDFSTNLKNGVLLINDTLSFSLSEAVSSSGVPNYIVEGKNESDTIATTLDLSIRPSAPNTVQLIPTASMDSMFITLLPNSINGYNTLQEDTLQINYIPQKVEKTGTLIIQFDTIPEYGILDILNNKKEVVRTVILESKEAITLQHLQPGAYTFRFLIDTNKDGKWTTGNIFTGEEAEEMIWFKSASNIRANWDVERTLSFSEYLGIEALEESEKGKVNPSGSNDN